jgi:hypothetical protein
MIDARRTAHVYHALKSLLEPIRLATTLALRRFAIRKWLPRYYSSDYRTYMSEPIMRMYIKARNVVDAIGSDEVDENDAPTWEFARDFVNKAAALTFEEVVQPPDPIIKPKHKVIFDTFKSKYAVKRRRVKTSQL